MRADALRQLGRFEAAVDAMTTIKEPDYATYVREMKRYCKAKDTRVHELRRPGKKLK